MRITSSLLVVLFATALLLAACCGKGAEPPSGADAEARGDWYAAVAIYEQAVARAPDDVQAQQQLERARLALGTSAVAVAEQRFVAGDLAGAFEEIDRAWEVLGGTERLQRARAELRQAGLAWAEEALRDGDLERAAANAEALARYFPVDPSIERVHVASREALLEALHARAEAAEAAGARGAAWLFRARIAEVEDTLTARRRAVALHQELLDEVAIGPRVESISYLRVLGGWGLANALPDEVVSVARDTMDTVQGVRAEELRQRALDETDDAARLEALVRYWIFAGDGADPALVAEIWAASRVGRAPTAR